MEESAESAKGVKRKNNIIFYMDNYYALTQINYFCEMKTAKTIDEQISILRSRGMEIKDEAKARESLLDIGYFRLGFYAFPFEKSYPNLKNRDHNYIDGAQFSDVVALYYFDMDLRNSVTYYLTRIEICLRTYLTYEVSNHYKTNPQWFADFNCVSSKYVSAFDKTYSDIKKNVVIQRHHKQHSHSKYAPAWKTLEFMTFGNILTLFDNLTDASLQQDIANHFGCRNITVFRNYMETLRILRNSCAHGACIYNIKLAQSIKSGPAGTFSGDDRHNIRGILFVLYYIIGMVSVNRKKDMERKVNSLIQEPRSEILDDIIRKSSGLVIDR